MTCVISLMFEVLKYNKLMRQKSYFLNFSWIFYNFNGKLNPSVVCIQIYLFIFNKVLIKYIFQYEINSQPPFYVIATKSILLIDFRFIFVIFFFFYFSWILIMDTITTSLLYLHYENIFIMSQLCSNYIKIRIVYTYLVFGIIFYIQSKVC